jgi:hypothetical protein
MRAADRLAGFVHEALTAGRGREEIARAARAAGWSEPEIARALSAWADTPFTPPVPRPVGSVSAGEAALYGLMFLALALTAWHVAAIAFHLIDRWLPAPGERAFLATASLRWSLATLMVAFPVFLLLDIRQERGIRRDPGRRRSAVRRRLAWLALFLAVLGLLGDLVAAIYAFLSGDLTLRFAAKAVAVALVALAVVAYWRPALRAPADV